MKCSVKGCAREKKTKGFCGPHYYAHWKYGDPLVSFKNYNALKTHCSNGHEFTPENTKVTLRKGTGKEKRSCKTCQNDLWQRKRLASYGLSQDEYDRMLLVQNNHCALCPAEFGRHEKESLHIDHDHTTGQVRGLLCHRCNLLLGLIESHEYLPSMSAISFYLNRSR